MREHEIFQSPNRIDITATEARATPQQWRDVIATEEVQVLPLAPPKFRHEPGWCTWGATLGDLPEVETMCGGINVKTPQHQAVWRQGNLLHFGFQQMPSEFNDTGRALLENAIVYIARFTEDRPSRIQGRYGDRSYPRLRALLRRSLQRPDATPRLLTSSFPEDLRDELTAKPVDEIKAWIRGNLDYLASGEDGFLRPDPDAVALRIALGAPSFFPATLAAAGQADTGPQAVALLARRVPEGPGAGADAAAWQAFVAANRDYLYFSENEGYVWRIDPLAKKRGVPTAELRGSRRASSRG